MFLVLQSYQKAWREYVKFRHLLANKPKVSYQDRHKLMQKEMRLQDMRTKSNLKRDVTVVVSSKGFYRTGIMCDIVQVSLHSSCTIKSFSNSFQQSYDLNPFLVIWIACYASARLGLSSKIS